MFWKRWFGYESLKLDSAPMWPVDVGKPVISKLKTEIISLQALLEYQTDLAKSFRDRVHELEKQVTELTADRDELAKSYWRVLDKLTDTISEEYGLDGIDEPETDEPADSVGEETESDPDSHLPTLSSLAGIGIETPDSEETQVFDSKGYGEQ